MALELVVPGVMGSPVRHYPISSPVGRGLIAIRLADYVAGGATVVTDAFSVAGDVVREDQAVTAPTDGLTDPADDAADTVVIPTADLALTPGWRYVPFLGCRVEGDSPTNARANDVWRVMSDSYLGPQISILAAGDGGAWRKAGAVPRNMWEHYSIIDGYGRIVSPNDDGDLKIRAYGCTGGDQVFFLDVLYLVPVDVQSFNQAPGDPFVSGDFIYNADADAYPPNGFGSGGTVDDGNFGGFGPQDLVGPSWLGQYSAIVAVSWLPAPDYSAPNVDYQEADDEPTVFNVQGFGFYDRDPKTFALISAGAERILPHTIDSDSFDRDTTGAPDSPHQVGESDYPRHWSPGFISVGDTFCDGSELVMSLNTGFHVNARVVWLGNEKDPYSTLDYSQMFATFTTLHAFSMSVKVRWSAITDVTTEVAAVGNFQSHLRTTRNYLWFGVVLRQYADGHVTAALSGSDYSFSTFVGDSWHDVTAEETISGSYTPGDQWNVKVERRWYHWRAKVWAVDDDEPADWLLDGYEFGIASSSFPFTTRQIVDYPYTDNYPGTGLQFLSRDPTDAVFSSDTDGRFPFLGTFQKGDDVQSVLADVSWDDFLLEYPGGDEDPVDTFIAVRKLDGTDILPAIRIPYGSARFLWSPKVGLHFSGDTEGYNCFVWKDGGSGPQLEAAWCEDFFEFQTHVKRQQIMRWR